MLRLIFLLAGLLLVVRRYRVQPWRLIYAGRQEYDLHTAWRFHLLRRRRSQAQSKRSSARRGSLGRVLGRFARSMAGRLGVLTVSQAAILRRLGANGIKESSGTFMESGKSAPDHPIRDY